MSVTTKRAASVASCVVGLALAVLAIALKQQPLGYFDSTKVVGYHDDQDVLHFRRGEVTWETICGNSPAGTFGRSNGLWIWRFKFESGGKRVSTKTFILHPGVFSLRCVDVAMPSNVLRLTRRLIPPVSGDDGGDENDLQAQTPNTSLQPKTQLLRDALDIINRTTNGAVSIDTLPDSIRALNPTRALVTSGVLVVYTTDKKGKILNPQGGRSVPAINMFMISGDDELGVFNFESFW